MVNKRINKCFLKIKHLIRITGIVVIFTLFTIIFSEFATNDYVVFIIKIIFFFELLVIMINAIFIFKMFSIIEKLNLNTRG